MTVAEYYAEIKRLGLEQTPVRQIYRTASGEMLSVPDPSMHTAEQRQETINRLKILLGIETG